MLTVTYPAIQWYRYRKQCGITSFRTVVEYDGMTTRSVRFDAMPSAVQFIEQHANNIEKMRVPQDPNTPLGTEARHMTLVGIPKRDFKISIH